MQLPARKKGLEFFLHVAGWTVLGFLLLFYPPLTWDMKTPVSFWTKQVFNLCLMLGVFYLNADIVAPRLFLKGKIPAFVVWVIVIVVCMLVAARFVEVRLRVFEDLAVLKPGFRHKNIYSLDMHLFMAFLLTLVISTTLALLRRWKADEEKRELIEKQQITSELTALKAQINPHFFFNTLNNIYALTYSDVPVSRDAILKLSRMMRYVLYETNHDTALLSKEISFIRDYIELMKLRLHACTKVQFEHPTPDQEYVIAPMLLLPFIENAFKHGASTMEDTEIVIRLNVTDGVLALHILNQIYPGQDSSQMESGGIGLPNTQRRLDILYPGKHELVIDQDFEKRMYRVDLKINLRYAVKTEDLAVF